jgi:poly(3-hydroxybutyrate) depolymerase
MRRMLSVAAVVAAGLIATPPADAAIPQVFTKTATPINCTVQASGQRFCGTSTAQILSWDGIPLDVAVGFPPAPNDGSPDGPYPVVGIYHGWGGTKLSLSGSDAQRALTRGFAVFTMTDRGWGGSCGRTMISDPRCAGKGYIHLMHNAYEVRDAQYALGQLADDGLIDPQRIGATGGSYGGGMSIALGALRTRTQLADGSLVPWTSPLGMPMSIAATSPSSRGATSRKRSRPTAARLTTSPMPPISAAIIASACRSRAGTTRSISRARCSAITRRWGATRPRTSRAGRR